MARRQFGWEWASGSITNLVEEPTGNEQLIRRLISLVGPPGRSWINFFRLPDGLDLFAVNKQWWPDVWLQAAGTAQAMTVEWRRLEEDRVHRLYTIGRGGPRDDQPGVRIEFNDGAAHTEVFPDEVFTAEEAGDIFVQFFANETVSANLRFRVHEDVAG